MFNQWHLNAKEFFSHDFTLMSNVSLIRLTINSDCHGGWTEHSQLGQLKLGASLTHTEVQLGKLDAFPTHTQTQLGQLESLLCLHSTCGPLHWYSVFSLTDRLSWTSVTPWKHPSASSKKWNLTVHSMLIPSIVVNEMAASLIRVIYIVYETLDKTQNIL